MLLGTSSYSGCKCLRVSEGILRTGVNAYNPCTQETVKSSRPWINRKESVSWAYSRSAFLPTSYLPLGHGTKCGLNICGFA